MQNASLVGVVDRSRHLHQQGCGLTDRRFRFQSGGLGSEAVPSNEPHAKVLLPFVLADLVSGDDIGVIQIGRRFCLGTKPLLHRLARQRATQDHY
jgi:hypothetical protein